VYDGLGSVVGEVAPDGTLTRSQSFDVYGCVRTSSGTATTKHKFVGSLGHPSDDETGLIYMRARHYDPVCGRFVSEDPGRSGTNWLNYCGGNPVASADPDGRFSFDDACKWLLLVFAGSWARKGTAFLGSLLAKFGDYLIRYGKGRLGDAANLMVIGQCEEAAGQANDPIGGDIVGRTTELDAGEQGILGVQAVAFGIMLKSVGEFLEAVAS
jgi:RHS repeat-associated protein